MAQAQTLADVYARIRTCQADGTQRRDHLLFGDSNTRGMAIDPDRARRAYPARVWPNWQIVTPRAPSLASTPAFRAIQ